MIRAGRPRHPNKHIEDAVQYAISKKWRYKPPGKSSHSWGRLLCPFAWRGGCILSVWSTPRNPSTHARMIERKVDNCPH